MNVSIYRFHPGKDKEAYYQDYTVNVTAEDRWTVMQLLEHIADTQDPTLAFFTHSACRHGICGRCTVRINGKPGLACHELVDGTDLVLDPLKQPVVRDLVVQM